MNPEYIEQVIFTFTAVGGMGENVREQVMRLLLENHIENALFLTSKIDRLDQIDQALKELMPEVQVAPVYN